MYQENTQVQYCSELDFFDVLQVTRIARYSLHSTSSADTWRERKMLFNRVFGTEFRGQLLYKMDP